MTAIDGRHSRPASPGALPSTSAPSQQGTPHTGGPGQSTPGGADQHPALGSDSRRSSPAGSLTSAGRILLGDRASLHIALSITPAMPQAVSQATDAQIAGGMQALAARLANGGLQLLTEAAKNGFAGLPKAQQSLSHHAMRLLGLEKPAEAQEQGPLQFAQLSGRLDKVSQLIEQGTSLDASKLPEHLENTKLAAHAAASGVRNTPAAELVANRVQVKQQLGDWVNDAEALHERMKTEHGKEHPLTSAALEARSVATNAQFNALSRMVMLTQGRRLYDATVGPAIATLTQWLGGGR